MVLASLLAHPDSSTTRSSAYAPAETGLMGSSQRERGREYVTASTFQGEWPLAVPTAYLVCTNGSVTAEINGVQYAVNGTARSRGYPEIEPYWRFDPEAGVGLRVNIGPFISYGLSLCGM
jgi:hypothetical protein